MVTAVAGDSGSGREVTKAHGGAVEKGEDVKGGSALSFSHSRGDGERGTAGAQIWARKRKVEGKKKSGIRRPAIFAWKER